MPVVTLEDAKTAVPLAQALLAGGISVIEIVLRTPAAEAALAAVASQVAAFTPPFTLSPIEGCMTTPPSTPPQPTPP